MSLNVVFRDHRAQKLEKHRLNLLFNLYAAPSDPICVVRLLLRRALLKVMPQEVSHQHELFFPFVTDLCHLLESPIRGISIQCVQLSPLNLAHDLAMLY